MMIPVKHLLAAEGQPFMKEGLGRHRAENMADSMSVAQTRQLVKLRKRLADRGIEVEA